MAFTPLPPLITKRSPPLRTLSPTTGRQDALNQTAACSRARNALYHRQPLQNVLARLSYGPGTHVEAITASTRDEEQLQDLDQRPLAARITSRAGRPSLNMGLLEHSPRPALRPVPEHNPAAGPGLGSSQILEILFLVPPVFGLRLEMPNGNGEACRDAHPLVIFGPAASVWGAPWWRHCSSTDAL